MMIHWWEAIPNLMRLQRKVKTNKGMLMLNATCTPQNIAFPKDINPLNEARENLETIIDTVCYEYNESKPRPNRQKARKDYLLQANCSKRVGKLIRTAIKKQLQYVRRELGYLDRFLAEGKELSPAHAVRLDVIRRVYEKQKYMYDNKVHLVAD